MSASKTIAVLAIVIAAAASCSSDEIIDGDSTAPVTTAPATPALAGELALSGQYERCVTEAGFSPMSAQVLVTEAGQVWHVKTSPEVPAEFHGPCFELIGGVATTGSSWDLAPCPTGSAQPQCTPPSG